MPIYEYQCKQGHSGEHYVSAMSHDAIACPQCGGVSTRVMSVPAPPRMGRIYDSQNHPEVKTQWDKWFNKNHSLDFCTGTRVEE